MTSTTLPVALRRFAPVALLRFAPVALRRFAPVALLRFAPVALLRFAPVALLRFAPVALRRFAPVALRRFAPVALLLAAPVAVAADPVVTYSSTGSVDAAEVDPRTHALDAAFASAVTEAVADLAGTNARAQAAAVDREIVKRARRFVVSFAVQREGPRPGDLFELTVDVRIDHGKLATRLVELGVTLRDPAGAAPAPPVVQRRRATVLYRLTGAGPLAATFGSAARGDVVGAELLVGALERGGYSVVPASAAGPPPDADGDLPVDDLGARALAADVGADAALVVSVAVGAVGPVRGTPLVAAPARAWLHLVDVKTNRSLREAAIVTGAWGDRERVPLAAATAAAAQLASHGFGSAVPAARVVDAPPLVASWGITVRIVGDGAWNAAALIRADLSRAPGVTAVGYAGVGVGAVALAVVGASVDKVAGVARVTPGFSARTRVEDGVVVVKLQ